MSRKLLRVSAGAGCRTGFWVAVFSSAALAQTELSLQETELSVTANHSGNQTVNIHLDSLGSHAAVYGIVGRANGQGAAPMAPPAARGPEAPIVVRSDRAMDWIWSAIIRD